MKEPPVSQAAQAAKEEGNRLFGMGKYSAAIESYTHAALEAPTWAVPFVNRALCYRKRKEWAKCLDDSERALQLDGVNVKATFMMGVSLLKLGRVDVATRTLAKALELARERGAAMQDDIWRMLARAKYTAYLQSPAPGLAARRRELLGRLGPLLEAEAARREAAGEPYAAAAAAAAGATQRQGSGAEASTSGGAAAAAAAASDSGVTAAAGAGAAEGAPSAEPMDAESGDAAAQQGDSAGGDQLQLVPSASCAAPPPQQPPQEPPTLASDLSLLASAFAAADALDARRDPPAEFCCPLTLEVFRDPVLGPCGHSYERSALLEHLAKVGHFDPITRKPLKEAQLVKNVGLRVAAHAWLDAHPWAYGDICGPDDGADD